MRKRKITYWIASIVFCYSLWGTITAEEVKFSAGLAHKKDTYILKIKAQKIN